MRTQPKIPLRTWAARKWDPPPGRRTLYNWVRNASIEPPPEKLGRSYYVDQESTLVDRNGWPVEIDGTPIFSMPAPPSADSTGSVKEQHQHRLAPPRRLLNIAEILRLDHIDIEAGVYFLFMNGVLQYVGLSVCMYNRIAQHEAAELINFDESRCLPIDDKTWRDILEKEYIAFYKPPCNIAFVKRTAQLPCGAA